MLRSARFDDSYAVLELWALLYDGMDAPDAGEWREHARAWFAAHLGDESDARIAVVDVDGGVVATAVGTIERGVPNPYSPIGLGVRLSNVITHPDQRGRGHGTALTRDVIAWAASLGADRIDLSATRDGQRVYEELGFTYTSSPRMKLVL